MRITINGARVEFDVFDHNGDDFVLVQVDGVILGGFPNSEMAMEAVAYRLEQLHRTAGSNRSAA